MTQAQREGAAREAVVTADLLRKGFEVLTSVSGNSPFDLAVYKGGEWLRIEVKGIRKNLMLEMHKAFDVLARVDGAAVRYEHSAFHTPNTLSKELAGECCTNPNTTHYSMQRRRDFVQKENA